MTDNFVPFNNYCIFSRISFHSFFLYADRRETILKKLPTFLSLSLALSLFVSPQHPNLAVRPTSSSLAFLLGNERLMPRESYGQKTHLSRRIMAHEERKP